MFRQVLLYSTLFIVCAHLQVPAQYLKTVVYDFDGFDLQANNLPEGDYSYGDLDYEIAANPLGASDMLGDRVLKLNLVWNNGYGAFGRGLSKFIEFNKNQDALVFYFYNPVVNNQAAVVEIAIADDDNQNNTYESASDDSWRKDLTIGAAPGWQLITVPFAELTDANTGGNGIFDIGFTHNSMLQLVEFRFARTSPSLSNPVFYIDMICFAEGALPHGNNILDLPAHDPEDHCLLGAHHPEAPGEFYKIPEHFEGMFPAAPGKNIKYVNTYLQWGIDGTAAAKAFPGQGIQLLIDDGYTPVITWEPQFKGFASLDPVQPRLHNIIDGDYDQYLDGFADKVKLYTGTVIIRLMHEFNGDWYPWCISQNTKNPAEFAQAFRKVVQRFQARGVNNVKWMWCPNNDYAPYSAYNWIADAYPGNAYVDIVATDVYNAHYPAALPWWRSFRWQTAEIYYYLTRYFPSKPFFICELACRERTSAEVSGSESKAEWFERLDKALQSEFHKTRALIFFDEFKGQTWQVNSTTNALNALTTHIWNDAYYFGPSGPTALGSFSEKEGWQIGPNPVRETINVWGPAENTGQFMINIYSHAGVNVYAGELKDSSSKIDIHSWPRGLYILEITGPAHEAFKLIVE